MFTEFSLHLNLRIYQVLKSLSTESVAFITKYLFPRLSIHGFPWFPFKNVHDPEWPVIILMVNSMDDTDIYSYLKKKVHFTGILNTLLLQELAVLLFLQLVYIKIYYLKYSSRII